MLMWEKKGMCGGPQTGHDSWPAKLRESHQTAQPCASSPCLQDHTQGKGAGENRRQLSVNNERNLLHNNVSVSFNVFIFSTLLLPSAVPDKDAHGYLALQVKQLKVAFQ